MTSHHLRSSFESIFDKGRKLSQPGQGYNGGARCLCLSRLVLFSSLLRGAFDSLFFSASWLDFLDPLDKHGRPFQV